ncbi:hypothetical protein Tco_0945719 [Tanacetum coccineum]
MKILRLIRVKVDKKFGYGYLEEIMLERRIMWSLERLVGGRNIETDYYRGHQNQRDLPRDIPIVRLEVLRYNIKRSKVRMGIMPTKTELALEQSQQSVSNEVLNIRVIPHSIHSDDGNPSSANIKQALRLKRASGHRKDEHELTTQSVSVRGFNTLSWKYCQGDSSKLNLLDHRLIQRWSVQDESFQGRLFNRFQDEGKYEHVGLKSQDHKKARNHKDFK